MTTAPPATDSGTTRTDAAWVTPGTWVIAVAADGLISEAAAFWAQGAATATSAPVVCHDPATSLRATASLTMPVNDAMVTARTSVRAGSAKAPVAADARVRPTNPTTPRRRADTRARPRTSTWYRRRITITASTATSTGAPLAYRSTRPDCVRAMTIPPIAAAAAVTSTITLVTHGRWRRCPWARRAARRRRGSRCGRAVAQPVPAVAMTSAARPGHQAAGPSGAAFGISSTASVQAITAAGTQGSAAPRNPSQNSCRSDAPRARSRVNSADRRPAIIRAASSSITALATARPT